MLLDTLVRNTLVKYGAQLVFAASKATHRQNVTFHKLFANCVPFLRQFHNASTSVKAIKSAKCVLWIVASSAEILMFFRSFLSIRMEHLQTTPLFALWLCSRIFDFLTLSRFFIRCWDLCQSRAWEKAPAPGSGSMELLAPSPPRRWVSLAHSRPSCRSCPYGRSHGWDLPPWLRFLWESVPHNCSQCVLHHIADPTCANLWCFQGAQR